MKRPSSYSDREYFTTYDIARLLELAPRTISRLIDRGHLKASRLPKDTPRGGNRRVHREDLLEYLKEEGYDQAVQILTPPRIINYKALFLGCYSPQFLQQIEKNLPEDWTYYHCLHPIAAGVVWQEHHPLAVVIDFSIGNYLAHTTAQWLSQQGECPYLVGLLTEEVIKEEVNRDLKEYGWSLLYPYPYLPGVVVDEIVRESKLDSRKGGSNGNLSVRSV